MMESPWQSGRIWRLCRKELQETLRDRRTVVTLLMMPILVYPLLSIVMQKLLLTSASKGVTSYVLGVETTKEGEMLLEALKQSQSMLQERTYQPIRIHRLPGRANSKTEPSDEPKVVGADADVPQFDIQVIEEGLQSYLKEGMVDLAISVTPPESAPAPNMSGNPFRFRVSYRQNDTASEAAVEQLRIMMQVINDKELVNRSKMRGREYRGAIEMFADPIRVSDGGPGGLVAVLPLVLLLMTITGAVYPAIDLTAGERERGTMESLIASPVPRYSLLLSKYVAVVTVAVLTAIANLLSMWVTLSVTGVGKALFGAEGLTLVTMLQIFPLLLVFACFFSAILLALCSFAKSFKEAQAYLIPVMLVSLAPGLLSLMPGVKFTSTLAVVPLVNMILLSRDILTQSVDIVPACAAILSTLVYAAAILSLAAKLFGSDATHHGGQGSWSDLWSRPETASLYPTIGQLCTFLAIFYPIYFVSTNLVGQQSEIGIGSRLWINAFVTCILFLGIPSLFARVRRIRFDSTFRWTFANVQWWIAIPGILLLGSSLWMVAHELFVLSMQLHLASLTEEQIQLAKQAKVELIKLPLIVILLTSAVLPAIAEEFFFRGFVLSSLHRLSPIRQVLLSGILFGLFHVLSGNTLSIERFIPTAFLGIVLGWVAFRTGSLLPGILLHAGHNGLMFSLAYYETWLTDNGWGIGEQQHLPGNWLATGALCLSAGIVLVWLSGRKVVRSE